MTAYIFPGLHPQVRMAIDNQTPLVKGAEPLYEAIVKQIYDNGGISDTIDLLLLENCRGKDEREIRERLRSRRYMRMYKSVNSSRWTTDEIKTLLKNSHKPINDIAKLIDRSKSAIGSMMIKLGIRVSPGLWTTHEISVLLNNRDKTVHELANILNRSKDAIYTKRIRLGLQQKGGTGIK